MKKLHIITLALSFVIAFSVSAQIKKGAVLLGGNLGGFSQHDFLAGAHDFTQKGFSISPVAGIAVKQDLILGVSPSFGWLKTRDEVVTESYGKSTVYGGSFFIRKYKAIGKGGFSIFVQGDIGALSGKGETHTVGNDMGRQKNFQVYLSAYPGVSFALSRRLQLETGFNDLVSISWATSRQDLFTSGSWTNETKARRFAANTSIDNFNSSFYLGFRVLLNKS